MSYGNNTRVKGPDVTLDNPAIQYMQIDLDKQSDISM